METSLLAQKLAQFESTHENKQQLHACLDFCVNYFTDLKPVVTRYEDNGVQSVVIANSASLQPDVMLLCHIDTVPGNPEQFAGRIVDGKLYGRGTLDMKAFVATSMKVMENILKTDSELSVALAIVTDEELGGVYGARHLAEDIKYRPKVVLVPDDGEDLHVLVERTKRIFQVKFTAEGVEAHGSQPWKGENAIVKLFTTYQKLQTALQVPTAQPTDTFIDTCNLGMISGGVASNEVPERAEMTVDIRVVTKSRSEVDDVLKEVCGDGVSFDIELEGHPTNLDIESPVVKKYIAAIQKHTTSPIEYKRAGGATDARYFAANGALPIVHQSHGRNAQARDEYVLLSELETLVEIQTDFIKSL